MDQTRFSWYTTYQIIAWPYKSDAALNHAWLDYAAVLTSVPISGDHGRGAGLVKPGFKNELSFFNNFYCVLFHGWHIFYVVVKRDKTLICN